MLYQRKEGGNWTAGWYVPVPDGMKADGKPKHKLRRVAICTGTTDRKQAEAVERQYREAIRDAAAKRKAERFILDVAGSIAGTAIPRAGFPLSGVWDRVEAADRRKRRTDRSIASKRCCWDAFMEWLRIDRPDYATMQDISRKDARHYMERFAEKAASTFNNHKHCLSAIWSAMMVDADLPENIWSFAGTGGTGYVSFRPFTQAEVLKIMEKAGAGFWRSATAIGFYTGLRLTDIVHLHASQFQGEYIVLKPKKTARKGKAVYIFIHPTLARILAPLLTTEGHLFPDAVARYKETGLAREYSAILKAAGVHADDRGKVSFHSLRSTFITTAEAAGVDRRTVQGVVGHGSPQMTARYNSDTTASRVLGNALPDLLEVKP